MTKLLRDIALGHSQSIIEKARNGDDKAFTKLVGLWFKKIYNFCLKYFGDHDMAMETTQKTFIALYQNLTEIRDTERLKFWLYKVARNYCYEEGRKQKKTGLLSIFQNQEVEQKPDSYFHPERKLQTMEKEQWVSSLLLTLPDEQRTVIIMKEYEDMKFREIAEVLDISENTVKSRLYYGLKSLRKQIEQSGYAYKEEV
ncbi:MAG TPA: RNA polymerase subunit sigma [Cytophagales bacterium]|jgi:RNA polymerase sigma factor (sigma-70 family)|nr:RNA polymerase subunit sigma [Cytophagales bacterium]